MPHFCADELMALLGALPLLSGAFFWVRSKLSRKNNSPLSEKA